MLHGGTLMVRQTLHGETDTAARADLARLDIHCMDGQRVHCGTYTAGWDTECRVGQTLQGGTESEVGQTLHAQNIHCRVGQILHA